MSATPRSISAHMALAARADYAAIIDVRSEGEFAVDCFPGAINAPVLDNTERARVGTLYKQVSPFEARKLGAALVARNIARHLETRFAAMPRDWNPLIYCWRGGSRSGAMAQVFAQIGWRVQVVEGGYQAYRRCVVHDLEQWPAQLQFVVLCGRTGCGKTRLLHALAQRSAQVLDLEGHAHHRGSVLGIDPQSVQPSQKAFESSLHAALAAMDHAQPIFVESESAKIGALRVPQALHERIRAGRCLRIEMDDADRCALLLEEYRHLCQQPTLLRDQLARLRVLHGHAVIERWEKLALHGDWQTLIDALLREHYDPAYLKSTPRYFPGYANAVRVEVSTRTDPLLEEAARRVLAASR